MKRATEDKFPRDEDRIEGTTGYQRGFAGSPPSATARQFATGATRDIDTDKLQYEGFLSPLVLRRYAEFMHKHRKQRNGELRAADNWQKGIPLEVYADSGWRHFMDWWGWQRKYWNPKEGIEEALCALLFNVMGALHVLLKKRQPGEIIYYTPGGPDDPTITHRD